jgi:hypothetical protein
MKREQEIIEKFNQISNIEPSAEWNKMLMKRFNQKRPELSKSYVTGLILISVIILLMINILSFSHSKILDIKQQKTNGLKDIASEFMINTNSSKY